MLIEPLGSMEEVLAQQASAIEGSATGHVHAQGLKEMAFKHLLAHPLCDSLVVLLLHVPLSKLHQQ